MPINPSSHLGSYVRNFRYQSVKMTDCFLTDYISDISTKQFYIGDNLASEYARFLSNIVTTKDMTDEEFRKYRCNPWRLSDDLYGTTEFWFMLLHLNEMYSATEFTRRKIKIYKAELPDRINDIEVVMDTYSRLNSTSIIQTKRDIVEGIDGMWD